MNLVGEIVEHKVFGSGRIIECLNGYVRVLFIDSQEEKKFAYPSAFGTFLELDNEVLIRQIEEDKNILAKKVTEEKRLKEEHAQMGQVIAPKKAQPMHSNPISPKPSDRHNIAFKCIYCDGGSSDGNIGYKGVCSDKMIEYNVSIAKNVWCTEEECACYKYWNGQISRKELLAEYGRTKFVCYESQMLALWRAYAGVIHTKENKGKPMTFRNVKQNSLALLTTRLPHASQEERFIFAVFLVDDTFEGDTRDEGCIGAHPKFRIELSLNEAKKLKFWDYYFNPNKPKKIAFASGLHRYLTNIQAAQVLKKLCEIKKGTPQEELSKEFLDYYCRLKELYIHNIPLPSGALQRI